MIFCTKILMLCLFIQTSVFAGSTSLISSDNYNGQRNTFEDSYNDQSPGKEETHLDTHEHKIITYKCQDDLDSTNVAYFDILESTKQVIQLRIDAYGNAGNGFGRYNISITCHTNGICISTELTYARGRLYNDNGGKSASFMLGRSYDYSGSCEVE